MTSWWQKRLCKSSPNDSVIHGELLNLECAKRCFSSSGIIYTSANNSFGDCNSCHRQMYNRCLGKKKKSLHRGSTASTPEVKSKLANSPQATLSHLATNLQHHPAMTGQAGEEGQVSDWEFRPRTAQSSCFWLGVSRMTDCRSVQMLVNSTVLVFAERHRTIFLPTLSYQVISSSTNRIK